MKESLKPIGKVQFNNVLKGKIVTVHYNKCVIDYSLKEENDGNKKFKISIVLADKESEYNPHVYTVGLSSEPSYEKALSIIDKKVNDYLSKLSIEDKIRIGYGDENPFTDKEDKAKKNEFFIASLYSGDCFGFVLNGNESRKDLSAIFNKRLTMSLELQNGSKFVTALSILEIYNKELYKELGYSNLYDYTSDVFGMGKTNTNDYKNVAMRFSKFDKVKNCLVIDERLKEYNFSQLNLLKELSVETILKDYPTTLTIREIKDRLRNAMNFLENNKSDESDNTATDSLSDNTGEVLSDSADKTIDNINNSAERYSDDEKPYKTYMVSSVDFKSVCLDKEKLHKYMSNIMKELVTVLTDSMDKYGEVDICLLRKKGNEIMNPPEN